MCPSVLIMDDDPNVGAAIGALSGYKVTHRTSISHITSDIATRSFDAIVVNTDRLSEVNIAEFFLELNKVSKKSCIFVTMTEILERVVMLALKHGACDFIASSAPYSELITRLNIRMNCSVAEISVLNTGLGGLSINQIDRTLRFENRSIDLTLSQMKLLLLLVRNVDSYVSRSVIARELWANISVSQNSIDKKISDFRQLIRDLGAPFKIVSLYGKGFKMIDTSNAMTIAKAIPARKL